MSNQVVEGSDVEAATGRDRSLEALTFSLFRLTRVLRASSRRWMELPGNLKRSDVAILRVLAEQGPARSGAIACELGIGPSAVSRQVAALAEADLVERRPDPEDGRAELISLAEEGRHRLEALRRAFVERLQSQFQDWDEARLAEVGVLLDDLADLLVSAFADPQGAETVPDA